VVKAYIVFPGIQSLNWIHLFFAEVHSSLKGTGNARSAPITTSSRLLPFLYVAHTQRCRRRIFALIRAARCGAAERIESRMWNRVPGCMQACRVARLDSAWQLKRCNRIFIKTQFAVEAHLVFWHYGSSMAPWLRSSMNDQVGPSGFLWQPAFARKRI